MKLPAALLLLAMLMSATAAQCFKKPRPMKYSVKTGGSGTDMDVYVQAKMSCENWTKWRHLDASGYDDHERWSFDEYGYQTSINKI